MKYRTKKGETAFNGVRLLTRLPPEAKRRVAIGQLILTFGSELHHQPMDPGTRLAANIARWVLLGNIADRAASVHGRHEPELRLRAERILGEELGEPVNPM